MNRSPHVILSLTVICKNGKVRNHLNHNLFINLYLQRNNCRIPKFKRTSLEHSLFIPRSCDTLTSEQSNIVKIA